MRSTTACCVLGLLVAALPAQSSRILCRVPYYDASQMVYTGGVSADGSVIAMGGKAKHDGRSFIQVFDRASGKRTQKIPSADIVALAVSPDGKLIAAVGEDRVIQLFNAKSGKRVKKLVNLRATVLDLEFSPSGQHLVSTSHDGLLRVWSCLTTKTVWQTNTDSACSRIVYSPDGARLAGCERDGTVTVWEAKTGKPVLATGGDGPLLGIDFSSDGKSIYRGDDDVSIAQVEIDSGKVIARRRFAVSEARWFRLSPDSKRVVLATKDFDFSTWDMTSGKKLGELFPHQAIIDEFVFSADGAWFVTFSRPGQARVFDGRTLQLPDRLEHWRNDGTALAWSPDGRYLAGGSHSGEVLLWDARTRKLVQRFAGHALPIIALRFAPDGRKLLSTDYTGEVRVWSPAAAAATLRITSRGGYCSGMTFAREGSRIVAAWDKGGVHRFDARTGDHLGRVLAAGEGIVHMTASPDDRWIGVSREDATIEVFDLTTDRRVAKLDFPGDRAPHSVAFDWNRQHLAARNWGDSLALFDLTKKKLVFHQPKAAPIGNLLFRRAPDALVSAVVGGEVRRFDLRTGKATRIFRFKDLASVALAMSPDGKQFAVALKDGTLRLVQKP